MSISGVNASRQLLACAALLALAACGSVTYKRGASPGAMSAAEVACRTEAPADATGFAQCMRARGWFVAELDAGAGAAVAGSQDDAAGASWFARRRAAQTAAPAPDTPVPATPAAVAARAADVPVSASDPAEIEPALPAAPSRAFDPMAPVAVSSWWKFGGSAGALDGAVTTCVAELGNAHRPDPALQAVTAGLRACLRTDGWYALGK